MNHCRFGMADCQFLGAPFDQMAKEEAESDSPPSVRDTDICACVQRAVRRKGMV